MQSPILASTIEHRPLKSLIPYAKNPRTHSAAQVTQIIASIREFGFTSPVLVALDGEIIAGHGRVMAAKELGLEVVPCIVLGHLSPAQKRAYVIADNKLALNAGWDPVLLTEHLVELDAIDFDITLTGFSTDEFAALTAKHNAGHTDPDETPEAPADPVSELGDVWVLGKHRILCGDSTDADCVEKVLAGVKPHLMVTDPPYGVKYDPDWRNRATRSGAPGMAARPIGGTSTGTVLNDDRADWREAWALFPGDVAYVWHGGLHANAVAESLEAVGFGLRAQIIWAKQILIIGRGDYHWKHEPCWYAVRKGKKGHWQGDRKQTTVWEIQNKTGVAKGGPGDEMQTGHGTQKPVECIRRPIENNSSPGQAVYEPFSGSGTTIIAAEMTGRLAHAIELNPAYEREHAGMMANLPLDPADLRSQGASAAGPFFDPCLQRKACICSGRTVVKVKIGASAPSSRSLQVRVLIPGPAIAALPERVVNTPRRSPGRRGLSKNLFLTRFRSSNDRV